MLVCKASGTLNQDYSRSLGSLSDRGTCNKSWLSDHDFHNITLASPTTDYKDERMNK